MTAVSYTRELAVARAVAVVAAQQIRALSDAGFECSTKEGAGIVTTADLVANRLICEGLSAAFPGDAILSEESGLQGPPDAPRRWVVDPLDGTLAFARGESGYHVHIALLLDSVAVVGVVSDPEGRRVAWATLGGGAWESAESEGEPRRLRVASAAQSGRLVTSSSMDSALRSALCEGTGLRPGLVSHGAGCKVLAVARGEGEVYFSHHPLHHWDTAAPALVAAEAGAHIATLEGERLDWHPRPDWKHSGLLLVTAGVDGERVREDLQRTWALLSASEKSSD